MRPPTRRSYVRHAAQEIELTPIMGLFVGLLPFLLMVAVFTKVTLIAVPLPKVAQSEAEIRKVEKELFYLKVHIIDTKTPRQVRSTPGYLIDSNALLQGPKFLPLTEAGTYDAAGLNEIILGIKKKNAQHRTIVIISGRHIPFQDVVHTLDATRETLPDLVGTPNAGIELFPDAIFDEGGST